MTTHEWAAEMLLDKFMADPDGPEALRLTHAGIRDGRWGHDYIDAIGQGPNSSWPMPQLAMFAMIHSKIYGGEVSTVRIGTTGTPQRDSMREENAETLSRLPRPFTALVDMKQHNEVGDGILKWDEPITVSLYTGLIDRDPDGTTRPLSISYEIPPGRAPLEIGQSLASRTWTHLTMNNGMVARWPYGHKRIILLVNHDFMAGRERLAALIPRKNKTTAAEPAHCPEGHALAGNQAATWEPCTCRGVREAQERRRSGNGHLCIRCLACEAEGRDTVYRQPPHVSEGPA